MNKIHRGLNLINCQLRRTVSKLNISSIQTCHWLTPRRKYFHVQTHYRLSLSNSRRFNILMKDKCPLNKLVSPDSFVLEPFFFCINNFVFFNARRPLKQSLQFIFYFEMYRRENGILHSEILLIRFSCL